MKYIFLLLLNIHFMVKAQDSSKQTTGFVFEDVDDSPVKVYCNQKVLNQSPNKFITVGYEYQSSSAFSSKESLVNEHRNFNAMHGLRVNFNTPVIAKNKIIVNLSGQYARTVFAANNYSTSYPLFTHLQQNGLHTYGLGTTIFKPLNSKNFVVFQTSVDANWLAQELKQIQTNALTISASVIYGWKKNDNEMFGVGASRTYRLGRIIYVPVILYNKTYNDKWGVEVTFPARAHVRRNINPKSLLLLGYELEGNQYAVYNNNQATTFLQRGEIKPRLMYERSLFGFWWLSVQTGLRINGRFNVVNKYDGKENNQILTNTLGNAFYCNVSINLVSL